MEQSVFDLTKNDTDKEYISTLKNPFEFECIKYVELKIEKGYNSKIHFKATVRFLNGQTSGYHRIEAKDFVDLVKKVELFVKNL